MYELYAYPYTYAMGAHLLLQECGVPYRVVDVSLLKALAKHPETANAQAVIEFKEVSPHLRVPALRLPDGSSQFESGAIALHLSDTLCNGQYSIAPDDALRPEYLQWLFYLSSTLQPEVMHQFHPEYYFDDVQTQAALKMASLQRLDEIWTILEKRYSNGLWMFDNRPTAVDFSLATVLLWDECFSDSLASYPNLSRTLDAIIARDACRSVVQWHQKKTTETGNPVQSTQVQMTEY